MTETSLAHFKRHRFPAEIIAHAVWLYYRFPLSFRDIEDLLAERGIDPARVAAFGDDTPDVEMLALVGHSFAMGNACDEVKEAARYVTASNDDDGIAVALRDVPAMFSAMYRTG